MPHKLVLALLLTGLMPACTHSTSGDNSADVVSDFKETHDTVDALTEILFSEDTLLNSDIDTATRTLSAVPQTTKRALVVGIGRYKDAAWPQIHGDSDVPMVKRILKNAGYAISTLTNSQATKQAIMSEFKRLAQVSNPGDTIYIHFSGHGQQITDTNGDEEDGLDEAWIPYDAMHDYSDSYHGENHIVDDEVAIWLTEMKNRIGADGQILVVVDACHSGDSSRASAASKKVYARGSYEVFTIPLDSLPPRTPRIPEQWLILTACRDYQVNHELCTPEGEYFGMLSYALCDEMPKSADLSNSEVALALQKFINRHRHSIPQDITVSGATDTHYLSRFF